MKVPLAAFLMFMALMTMAVQGFAQTRTNGSIVVEGTINYCTDAGSNDTYACSLSPAIAAYATGGQYCFDANTANTGAATLNLNSLGAKTIKKVAGGITTDLADNDIRAGQLVCVIYDGTNLQMTSPLGNAAAGGSGCTTCLDYTKHWEMAQVYRRSNGSLDLMTNGNFGGGQLSPWGSFAGAASLGDRAADSDFQFYFQLTSQSGTAAGGAQNAGNNAEWYRQANTRAHVRFSPITGTNARYGWGFTTCTAGTHGGADTPTCSQAMLIASTTLGTQNWYCLVGNGTSNTNTDTGVAWSAGSAYELDIKLESGQVICTVNGTATNVSTNMPATSTGMYGNLTFVAPTSGTADTTLRFDRMYLESDN